jgi:hypothetical protein
MPEMGANKMPRKRWLIVVIAFCLIVLCAAIVGFFFGPNAATQTLTLVVALAGAVAAFDKILPSSSTPAQGVMPVPPAKCGKLVATVLFAVGVLAGYGAPRIAGALFPLTPSAKVSAPAEVGMKDRAILTWRNVPQQYEVWLLVYDKGVYYPQEYRVRSIPNGSVVTDIDVGREDERGESFELIPVVAAPEAQKELQEHIVDGLGGIPVGAIPFQRLVVRRKM